MKTKQETNFIGMMLAALSVLLATGIVIEAALQGVSFDIGKETTDGITEALVGMENWLR